MQLQDLKYNRSRSVMVDGHGREYKIIKQPNKERYYIQHSKGQLTVTSVVKSIEKNDAVFNYIFEFGHTQHPCPAMDYWIIRHRLRKKISYSQFKHDSGTNFKQQ